MCRIRLSKIMALRGLCSRREADEWIRNGFVKVNGNIVNLSSSLFSIDEIKEIDIHPNIKQKQNKLISILLHKPKGYVSSLPLKNEKPAIQLLIEENYYNIENEKPFIIPRYQPKLAVVGRLDKDSRGLLIFSQDGRIVKEIIGENTEIEKEYIVTIDKPISNDLILKLHNMSLDGKKLKKINIKGISENKFRITLKEGRNRQIRRMFLKIQRNVVDIYRIRIHNFLINNLKEGKWKFFK